jgi:predicted DNA-binding transcriptional regulator YafY
MPSRDTAEAQLRRIFQLLPAAARKGGASFSELEEVLGTSPEQIARDITTVTDRAFYHASGEGAETQILVDAERVQLLSRGEFRRPPRLTTAETLAVGIALRALAADSAPERRAQLVALAERLERALSLGTPEPAPAVAAEPLAGADVVRDRLHSAARLARKCRIEYLKPTGPAPAPRVIHPYALVYAERWWYAIGFCELRGGIRSFRVDRIVRCGLLEDFFERPDGFDVETYLSGRRVFRADAPIEVRVRYSAQVAPWIAEREPEGVRLGDGALEVRYHVADPDWLVRHVLTYGPDARIVEPAELAESVRTAMARIVEVCSK